MMYSFLNQPGVSSLHHVVSLQSYKDKKYKTNVGYARAKYNIRLASLPLQLFDKLLFPPPLQLRKTCTEIKTISIKFYSRRVQDISNSKASNTNDKPRTNWFFLSIVKRPFLFTKLRWLNFLQDMIMYTTSIWYILGMFPIAWNIGSTNYRGESSTRCTTGWLAFRR